MIFMICSTVAPAFGVRIVSTPVILGCGGVDWACAIGASTVANASSRYSISIFIVQLLLIPREIVMTWYRWVPHAFRRHHKRKVASRIKTLLTLIPKMVLYGTRIGGED